MSYKKTKMSYKIYSNYNLNKTYAKYMRFD